jgi:hypothetical protein
MLLDFRSLFEEKVEQIADGASRLVERFRRRPIGYVRFTIHSWVGRLEPSGADALTSIESFTSAAGRPRVFTLAATAPDALAGTHRSSRLVWPSQSSDDANLDLAIFEEIERERKPHE